MDSSFLGNTKKMKKLHSMKLSINIITHIRTLYTGQHVYDSTVEPV